MHLPHVHLDAGEPLEGRAAHVAPVGLALGLVVNLHVTLQGVGLDEGRPAHLALERFDVVVNHHVLLELVLLVAGRAAHLAHVRPGPVGDVLAVYVALQAAGLDVADVAVRAGERLVVAVDLDVVAEVGAPAEGHAALRADVGLDAVVVDSLVVLEVVDGLRGQPADLADEGSVGGVAALVQLEAAGRREGLVALAARVGLDPRVLSQVHGQVVGPGVAGVAVGAGEGAVPPVHAQVAFQLILGAHVLPAQLAGKYPLDLLLQGHVRVGHLPPPLPPDVTVPLPPITDSRRARVHHDAHLGAQVSRTG